MIIINSDIKVQCRDNIYHIITFTGLTWTPIEGKTVAPPASTSLILKKEKKN